MSLMPEDERDGHSGEESSAEGAGMRRAGDGGGEGASPGHGIREGQPDGDVVARKRRKKSQPHPAYDDIYVSDFGASDKATKAGNGLKDPGVTAARNEYFERLGNVLILDKDSSVLRDECVVLQSTSNEKIMSMSAFQVLMGFFIKEARMTDGKFRSLVMQQGGPGHERKSWRPRIHKQQVHVIQNVRYPMHQYEWDALRSVILEALGGFGLPRLLEEDVEIEHVMAAVRRAVDRAREFQLNAPEERAGMRAGEAARVGVGVGGHQPQDAYEQHFGYGLAEEGDSDELARAEKRSVLRTVELNVDNMTFKTTAATLLSVPGSFFASLVERWPQADSFFVDRSPQPFPFVLEYLREKRFQQQMDEDTHDAVESLPLPTDPVDLARLKREAQYFVLPELVALIEATIET